MESQGLGLGLHSGHASETRETSCNSADNIIDRSRTNGTIRVRARQFKHSFNISCPSNDILHLRSAVLTLTPAAFQVLERRSARETLLSIGGPVLVLGVCHAILVITNPKHEYHCITYHCFRPRLLKTQHSLFSHPLKPQHDPDGHTKAPTWRVHPQS